MALGAMARDPNCKISIIACGLKYFKPHRFRSQVIVEFSTPYRIPQDLVEKYKTNKRIACGDMLGQVEKKMREVTLNAPSYKELKQIYMAREIYMPQAERGAVDQKFSDEQVNELYKRFFRGFNALRGHEKLKEVLYEIETYMKELKTLNMQDSEVKNMHINFLMIFGNFLVIIPKMLFFLIFVSH